jgi:hypothetical protein
MTLSMKTICHYAECLYAECLHAECRDLFIVMLNVVMLNVILLNVVKLSVVAPLKGYMLVSYASFITLGETCTHNLSFFPIAKCYFYFLNI